MPASVSRKPLDLASFRVQRHPTITHAPLSPLHVIRKMGFKDVVFCDCGSVLDLNTAEARKHRAVWVATHQECRPQEPA